MPPDDILELYVDSARRFHELILEHTRQAALAEMLAPQIHQDYRDSLTPEQKIKNTSDVDWEVLPEELRESNQFAAMRLGLPAPKPKAGSQIGRTILLRADMDALPMPEETGFEFCQRDPRPHARLRP